MNCPECRKLLEIASLRCPHCGVAIPIDTAPASVTPDEESQFSDTSNTPHRKTTGWRLPVLLIFTLILLYVVTLVFMSNLKYRKLHQFQQRNWVAVAETFTGTGNGTTKTFPIHTSLWRVRVTANQVEGDNQDQLKYCIDEEPQEQATVIPANGLSAESYIQLQPNHIATKTDFHSLLHIEKSVWQALIPKMPASYTLPQPQNTLPGKAGKAAQHSVTVHAPSTVRWEVTVEEAR